MSVVETGKKSATLVKADHIFIKEEPVEQNVIKNEVKKIEGKSPVKAEVILQIPGIKQKVKTCDICRKIFTKTSSLNRHILLHLGEKPFSCDICSLSFTQKAHLKKHKLRHEVNPFLCDVCQKIYPDEVKLKKHKIMCTREKRRKTSDKPYRGNKYDKSNQLPCKFCGKIFHHSSNLKRHTRTHTGEKPYHCELCNKSFSQSGDFKNHKILHTGEKAFPCTECTKRFATNQNLKYHMKIHSGSVYKRFSCDLCDKTYMKRADLHGHMSVHTGIKEFSCNVCKKAFARKGDLCKHIKIHRQTSCSICNKNLTEEKNHVCENVIGDFVDCNQVLIKTEEIKEEVVIDNETYDKALCNLTFPITPFLNMETTASDKKEYYIKAELKVEDLT